MEKREFDKLLTLDEVAGMLDSPPSSVAQLVARNAIPFERPQGKTPRKYKADELRFRVEAIEQWLKLR